MHELLSELHDVESGGGDRNPLEVLHQTLSAKVQPNPLRSPSIQSRLTLPVLSLHSSTPHLTPRPITTVPSVRYISGRPAAAAGEALRVKCHILFGPCFLRLKKRMKRGRMMKRLKARIKIGRDKAKRRMANKDTLERRANKAARKAVLKKLTKGKDKNDLPFTRRQELEKRLDKPAVKKRIKMLAKRMFKDVRKKEMERKKR